MIRNGAVKYRKFVVSTVGQCRSVLQSSTSSRICRNCIPTLMTNTCHPKQQIPSNTSYVLWSNDKRGFVTNAPTATNVEVAAASSATKKATTASSSASNVVIDNIGSIFLAVIAVIIGSLVRSHYCNQNRQRLRDDMEEEAAIDPFEIHDLRVANKYTLPINLFEKLIVDVIKEAKVKNVMSGTNQAQDTKENVSSENSTNSLLLLTYSEFVSIVRSTMIREMNSSETSTIQCGHLLDRVVAASTGGIDKEMTVTFWLTVLLMAVSCPVEDRFRLLYSIVYYTRPDTILLDSEENDNKINDESISSIATIDFNKKETISIDDVREMVGYLQSTCQLPPDAQILPTTTKYPTQQYVIGTPNELVPWGEQIKTKNEINRKNETSTTTSTGSTGGSELTNRDELDRSIDLDTFRGILSTKSVCVWGECYNRSIPS